MKKGSLIRAEAWERVKRKRGILIAASLVTIVPAALYTESRRFFPVSANVWISLALPLLTAWASMGVNQMYLQAAAGKKPTGQDFIIPYRKNRMRKTAALALAIFVVNQAVWMPFLASNSAIRFFHPGPEKLWLYVLFFIVLLLLWIIGVLASGVVVPSISYLYLLQPERPCFFCLREGLSLGMRNIDRILIYSFLVDWPILAFVLICAVAAFFPLMLLRYLLVPLFLIFFVFLFYYGPYVGVAMAAFYGELIQFDQNCPPSGRNRKVMRLVRTGGPYYCSFKKGPQKNGPLDKR